jgi:hypothetical protein
MSISPPDPTPILPTCFLQRGSSISDSSWSWKLELDIDYHPRYSRCDAFQRISIDHEITLAQLKTLHPPHHLFHSKGRKLLAFRNIGVGVGVGIGTDIAPHEPLAPPSSLEVESLSM